MNEHRKKPYEDNERLEFLGDAVLELTISQFLFAKYPAMSEGDLTKLRAAIVCEPSLVSLAHELSFGDLVLLGKGEEMTGGRKRPALLADVFEAFIGALYLDQGLEPVQQFLKVYVFPKINDGAFSHVMDFKASFKNLYSGTEKDRLSTKFSMKKGLPTTGNSRRLSLLKVRRSVSGTDVPKRSRASMRHRKLLQKCKNIIRNNKIPCFPRGFQYVCA